MSGFLHGGEDTERNFLIAPVLCVFINRMPSDGL